MDWQTLVCNLKLSDFFNSAFSKKCDCSIIGAKPLITGCQSCCVHQSGKSKYSEKLTFSHLNCLFRKISKLMVPMGEQQ